MEEIKEGKNVYCEKKMEKYEEDWMEMKMEEEREGIKKDVDLKYMKKKMMKIEKEIIERGEMGEIRNFRGIKEEDLMEEERIKWKWRIDKEGGGGEIEDIGSKIIEKERYMIGKIEEVMGEEVKIISERKEMDDI